LNAILGPAPSLVTPKSSNVFNKISVEDLFKVYFSRKLEGKSYLDATGIQNE
jgi:hypothetical protein